jgi:DNA replication protein DnaC
MSEPDPLRDRARALHLHGLLAHWSEVATQPWLAPLIDWDERERARRSLERRLQEAQIGRFKPLCDFDWNWPRLCDRTAIETLMTLDFLKDATNVVLVGQNGTGKTMLAQNITHQALVAGQSAVHHRWPATWRSCSPGQRFRAAPPLASLCPPGAVSHR